MVFAYNDVIGLEVPIERLELQGGVGVHLVSLLDVSSAEQIDLTPQGHELNYVIGRAKGKLAFKEFDSGVINPFPDKKVPRKATAHLTDDIIVALQHALATGPKAGVTVIPDGDALMFYSSDGPTVSWSSCPLPKDYDVPRITLSSEFCERLMALAEGGTLLEVFNDGVCATFNETGIRLIGKLILEEPLRDYNGKITQVISDDAVPIPIPEELNVALARVEVLAGTKKQKIKMDIEKDELRFEFQGDLGEVLDFCKLAGKVSEPIDAMFNAEHIKRGLAKAKTFIATKRAFVLLTEESFGYVVAAIR